MNDFCILAKVAGTLTHPWGVDPAKDRCWLVGGWMGDGYDMIRLTPELLEWFCANKDRIKGINPDIYQELDVDPEPACSQVYPLPAGDGLVLIKTLTSDTIRTTTVEEAAWAYLGEGREGD